MGTWLVIYIGLTCLFFGYFARKYFGLIVPKVDSCRPDDLDELLSDGAQLWDVRTYREWEARPTIAEHRPLGEFGDVDLDTVIICFCTSGIRARKAAEDLRTMGCRRPLWLDGDHLDIEKRQQ